MSLPRHDDLIVLRVKTATLDPSLTQEEFDRLTAFLGQAGPDAMNMEMLDSFFTALICGPDLVAPSEYLPEVWGEAFVFDSGEQAQDVLGLLMRHWNAVADGLLDSEYCYRLVLLQDQNGKRHGNDWAWGFFRAMKMRLEGWRALMNNEASCGLLSPIAMLCDETSPDPTVRRPQITDDMRDELLAHLASDLAEINRYFEPQRREMSRTHHLVQHRAGPKVGRNEPCPCGSGRKYKHCCAANAPVLH